VALPAFMVAAKLVISPLTAKTHITRALTKPDVRDRVRCSW
jgi:DNA-binding CsgD family transcriptional regulator